MDPSLLYALLYSPHLSYPLVSYALLTRGKYLCHPQKLSKLAAEALVNLSQDPRIFAALLIGGGVEEAMALISQPTFADKKLLVMLLANMTQKEEGASRLLQVRQKAGWGLWGVGRYRGTGWDLQYF